uniref:Uncharacterized protein n=1 Tax=Stegastes partitus TaxID=144197 RepID=A0A3B4Z5Q9_9TELE
MNVLLLHLKPVCDIPSCCERKLLQFFSSFLTQETFFANRDFFVLAFIVSLPVSQLGRLHTIVKDPEELF